MQPKQAFPLFIALVSLITFSLSLKAQSDTLNSSIDSLAINTNELVDKKSAPVNGDTTETTNSPAKSNLSRDAIESTVNYKARDTIKYNFAEQKVYLYGDAVVTYEDVELRAEYIELKMDSNIVFATGIKDSTGKVIGSPVFKEGKQEFRSQRITYNFNTEKGIISDVITQEGEGYVHGESVKKTKNDVVFIKNGRYTTCDHADPHFAIAAKNLKIIPDDKIVARPANLIIEGIPTPIVVPFGIFPNRQRGKSGLLIPMPGESDRDGFYLINGGYYFYLGEKADLEIEADIYSKGSYAIRPSFTYKTRYKRSGSIRLRHKNTVGGIIPEEPNYSVSKDYWFEWMHKQEPTARPNSDFNASVSLGTTTSYRNDINTPDSDFLRGNFTSKIGYSKDMLQNKLHFSINARQTQNNTNGTMNLTLPEANLSMNRLFPFKSKKSLSSKWYDNLGISYNGNVRNELNFNSDTLIVSMENIDTLRNTFRNGVQHNIPIGINFKLFKNVTLNPSINYREMWYFETTEVYMDPNDSLQPVKERGVAGFSRANTYNASANLTTKVYGMMQFRKGYIRAFRHVLTPSVGLSYRPENNQGLTSYSDNRGAVSKDVEYSIYKNGIYGQPNGKESGKVNMSLLNSFEMKVKTRTDTGDGLKKIKLLENLKISTGYDLVKDSLHWDDISLNGNSSISRHVNLVLGSAFDLYALKRDSVNDLYKSSEFEWNQNSRFARMKTGNIGLNFNLKGGKSKKKPKKEIQDGDEGLEDDYVDDDFSNDDPNTLRRAYTDVDWDVPWNLKIQFNLQYRQKINGDLLESEYITNTQATGDLSLTKNWKITYNIYFDTQEMKVNFANLGITRNLHCWQMTMNWTPIGANRKSYTFNIGVRANILSDLKLDKRSF